MDRIEARAVILDDLIDDGHVFPGAGSVADARVGIKIEAEGVEVFRQGPGR